MPIHLTCLTCGAPVVRRSPSQVSPNTYCSRRCMPIKATLPVIDMCDDGVTARIHLCARDGSLLAYALIDAVDIPLVSTRRWFLNNGYAVSSQIRENGKRLGRLRLHRVILGLVPGDGFDGDHINRDKLDCRRSNLRAATEAMNSQNVSSHRDASSKYRGVCWNKQRGKWMAALRLGDRSIYLGHFESEEEAAQVVRTERMRLMPGAVD